MPHVLIKMYPGRSHAQKAALAEAVTQSVMAQAGCSENAVSVAIQEVQPADWPTVYAGEIMADPDALYKKPGYAAP